MADRAPAVSICIPTYNYCRYLPEALDSALAQTCQDTEVVVVDDHSTDDTVALVKQYARRDARIVLYENPRRLGLGGNFNHSLRLARGKYIKFLCADDVLEKQCVEKMVSAMEANPAIRLVGCRRSLFHDERRVIGYRGYARSTRTVPGQQAIRKCFFAGNLIGEPTAVLFRKADAAQGFDEAYFQALDMELWFRLLEGGEFLFLADTLCGVREHRSRGTADNVRGGRVTADKVRLFERYGQRPWLKGSMAERIRWDARMASSVTREFAAGMQEVGETMSKACYFPGLARSLLVPTAAVLTRIRRRTGVI